MEGIDMAEKNPPHRPQIPIDWTLVDRWLEANCTGTEVAGMLGIHPDTLYNRCRQDKGVTFTIYSNEKKSKGDGQLKIKQYSEAMGGDRGMLIWLGKQRLGQKENHDISLTGNMHVGVVNYGSNKSPQPWQSEEKREME
jgi:hypothetical protein